MTKNFRKKTKNLIKKLVKGKDLKLFKMKIYIGDCSKDDIISICDFLLDMWVKITRNHLNIFFKYFAGYTRELIIEIDGETARPYLYFILFAETKNLPIISKLKSIAFFSLMRVLAFREDIQERIWNSSSDDRISFNKGITQIDEISPEEYEKVLDDLMLPCIRVINENKELEELLNVYQYNKQLCSRGGIISRKNLECNVALGVNR